MGGITKTVLKVTAVFGMAFALGYTEYRVHGGKPIYKLYNEAKAERQQTAKNRAVGKQNLALMGKGLQNYKKG